jgi:hypothetical protein
MEVAEKTCQDRTNPRVNQKYIDHRIFREPSWVLGAEKKYNVRGPGFISQSTDVTHLF